LAEEKARAKHLEFLAGGGEMGAMMRRHDWAATPLGSPERWPTSLRTAVSMVIGSRFPACLVWGPELVMLYNDAFRPILGGKPKALGRPFGEVWSEAWDKLGHFAEAALAGEAVFIENFPLVVERNGYPEQAYFTFCYSPVRDETGRIAGFLDTVIETTGQVRAEQALLAGQTRQTFLLELGDRLRTLSEPGDIMLVAAEMLGRHVGVARAGYGEIDTSGEVIRVERDWANGVPSLAGEARLLEGFGAAIAAELRAGRTLTVKDSETDPRAIGSGVAEVWASIDLRAVVAVPLIKGGRFVAFLYLHDPQPRQWTAEEEPLHGRSRSAPGTRWSVPAPKLHCGQARHVSASWPMRCPRLSGSLTVKDVPSFSTANGLTIQGRWPAPSRLPMSRRNSCTRTMRHPRWPLLTRHVGPAVHFSSSIVSGRESASTAGSW
jgi:GAF domain/PAS fold